MAPTRREVLIRLAAAGAGAVALQCSPDPEPKALDAKGKPRVAIVGGGAAGVMTAWLLDGLYDVTLFEGDKLIGGNVQTVQLQVRGQPVLVDAGAQYFHPGPYPTYVQLLKLLGIDAATSTEIYKAASSITIFAPGEAKPRFVSPIVPDRLWPMGEDWNQDGLAGFSTLTQEAADRDKADGDWSVSLESWLKTLKVSEAQREQVLLPWTASLFSGDTDHARQMSARAALIFLSRAAPKALTDAVYYQTLRHGLGGVVDLLLKACTTLTTQVNTKVTQLARAGSGFIVEGKAFDHLVLAAPAYACSTLLKNLDGTSAVRQALDQIQWNDATLLIHRDPIYAPADVQNQSFLNCRVQGHYCEASMRLATAVAPLADGPVDLWKSWASNRDVQPKDIVHQVQFKHMLPTVQTISGQKALAALNGQGGLWFAGGWTRAFDAQETALLSAMQVADGLGGQTSPHRQALAAALATKS